MANIDGSVGILHMDPEATTDDYDKAASLILGSKKPTADSVSDKLLFHAAGVDDQGLVVVEVWEDQSSLERHVNEKVKPGLEEAGMGGRPLMLKPHNISHIGPSPDGAYGILLDYPDGSLDQYDAVMEDVFGGLEMDDAPEGAIFHLAAEKEDGGFIVFDVWESPEAFQRFGERLQPAIEKNASELAQTPPRVIPLHNALVQPSVAAKSGQPAGALA